MIFYSKNFGVRLCRCIQSIYLHSEIENCMRTDKKKKEIRNECAHDASRNRAQGMDCLDCLQPTAKLTNH